MKSGSWIKMGFKIIKVLFIVGIVVLFIHANISDKQMQRTDNFNLNETFGMTAMVSKKEEEKPKPVLPSVLGVNKYRGDLTGYAADCPLCNGTLACKPSYNVYKNGVVTYPDVTYGNVRIVASSKKLACGSIIKFNLSTISNEPVYAVVLDRGILDRDIDLLMATERDAIYLVGRRDITYDVLRNGW